MGGTGGQNMVILAHCYVITRCGASDLIRPLKMQPRQAAQLLDCCAQDFNACAGWRMNEQACELPACF